MSEEKGLGKKILGLFVEQADGPESASEGKSAADLVAELAQQSGPAPAKEAPAGPALQFDKVAAPAGGKVDFDVVFKDAGMDAEELARVRKAEELLKSLPEATPHEVKKQIVEASLKAFGFDVAKIAAAAQNQRRALDAYVKVNEQLTAKGITDAQQQIQQHNEKIAALQKDIEKRTQTLAGTTQAAQQRKEQVQKVLDFFQVAAPPAAPGSGEGR